MERLTMRDVGGRAFWVSPQSPGGGYRLSEDMEDQRRLDRLAAYEDTGLEPEEIERMKEYMNPFTIQDMDRFREIMDAEKDGRLVVLPCKKGDTLWSYYDYPTWGISKILVTAVSTLDGITVINTDNYGVIPEKDIGKTVFLTREEAEAVLKKREEADNETD